MKKRKLTARERHEEIHRIADKLPPGERERWLLDVARYDNNVALLWIVLGVSLILAIVAHEVLK